MSEKMTRDEKIEIIVGQGVWCDWIFAATLAVVPILMIVAIEGGIPTWMACLITFVETAWWFSTRLMRALHASMRSREREC